MTSLSEVKRHCKKKNSEARKELYFFSSLFSHFFSWIFINLGINANQVTGLFFIVGLIGSLCFLSTTPLIVLVGYLLWRLHIIFDLCDGEVATFNNQFSTNGAYWDFMIHSLLYPMIFINVCIANYLKFGFIEMFYFAAFGSLTLSLMFAVKNNFYRALFENDIKKENNLNSTYKKKNILLRTFYEIFSFEGFLGVYLFSTLLELSMEIIILILLTYVIVFLAITVFKFISFSLKGD